MESREQKELLDACDAVMLERLKAAQKDRVVDLNIRNRLVCVIGSGPSAREQILGYEVCVFLNGSHQISIPDATTTIGIKRDSGRNLPIFYDDDPHDIYIMSERAYQQEQDVWRPSALVFDDRIDLYPMGIQGWAVWILRLLGAKALHLYGCDSAFGDETVGYDHGQNGEPYELQPRVARALAREMPIFWFRGHEVLGRDDIEPYPLHRMRTMPITIGKPNKLQ